MNEALIQAIVESPEDDMPRRICADWLEDYAQPERAEFIRLQIALARLPSDHPARPALQTRERGLLLAHERGWWPPRLRPPGRHLGIPPRLHRRGDGRSGH